MSRTIRNQRLDGRDGRSKLKPRREPYWVKIARGWHLGYRRIDAQRGTWVARYRGADYGKRSYKALGEADDVQDADGSKFLSFCDAQTAAEAFFKRSDDDEPHQRGALTVAGAIKEYLADRELRGGKSVNSDRTMLATHVLSWRSKPDAKPLGETRVDALTDKQLKQAGIN